MIQAHHDGADIGHPGIARTMEKMQRGFYFPGMYRKTRKYILACDSCNRNKFTRHKPTGKLINEDAYAKEPWKSITADFVEMPSVNHYLTKNILNALLVVVDVFSKFTVLIPTRKEATTEEIYHLLWERVFAVFGIPERMLSDRDKIFKTSTWAEKMKKIGSSQVLSTAHHQQTDGQSERKIQELQAYFRHYLDYDQENWLELTPIAQYALNDAINATTGETPNFVLFGIKKGEGRRHTATRSLRATTKKWKEFINKYG